MAAVTMARQAPPSENAARMIPRTSSKERNSMGLRKQVSRSALGQNSLGQGKQSRESEINKRRPLAVIKLMLLTCLNKENK